MRNRLISATLAVALISAVFCAETAAQETGLSTYSLYTFYGIGDIATQGSTFIRGMGGAAVAYRSSSMLSTANPAAYSAVSRNAFLFNIGLEQGNYYNSSTDAASAHNSFMLKNLSFEFPLAAGLGFGLTFQPFSNVGYRLRYKDMEPSVLANIGDVNYTFSGEGGISEIKAGVGYSPVRNLSVGANVVYYRGYVSKTFTTSINPLTGMSNYVGVNGFMDEKISSAAFEGGIQYVAISNASTTLTLGATYRPGGRLNNKSYREIPAANMESDTISMSTYNEKLSMPSTLTAGFNLDRRHVMVAADYEYRDWADRNPDELSQRVYRNTNALRVGVQYTPNPGDVRSILRRTSYRVGFRYSDYYMRLCGQDITEKVLTLGLGIPLRQHNRSNINLACELGQRGNTSAGLFKENFVKFALGFNFFGEDYWFVKIKYD